MIAKVLEKVKTSSVKSVILFGATRPAAAPYDVIKTEKTIGHRRFRIIAHRKPGENVALEAHIRELIVLLDGYSATTARTTHNVLHFEPEGIQDVSAVSDDGTISMEASFLMPTRTF